MRSICLVSLLAVCACSELVSTGGLAQAPAGHRLSTSAPAAAAKFTFRLPSGQEVTVDGIERRQELWRLTSSALPGASVTLWVAPEGDLTRISVKAASGGLTGLSVFWNVPPDYDCHHGFAGWAYEQHSCAGPRGTLASFCLSAACNNALVRLQDPSEGPARIGARLWSIPSRSFIGSSFVLWDNPVPAGTPDSARALADFFKHVRPTREASSSWLINSPPVTPGNMHPTEWSSEAAELAAQTAQNLHFGEVLLIDRQWARTLGTWDDRVPFAKLAEPFRQRGVCPIAHSLVSLVDFDNPLCRPEVPPSRTNCPSNAWLLGPDGRPVVFDWFPSGLFFWNSADATVRDAVTRSLAEGVRSGNACGSYGDAADFFQTEGAAVDWAAGLREQTGESRLRMSVGQSALSLFVDDTDVTDQWQVNFSHSPASWTHNWGYHLLRGEWQHLGNAPRLGWVPPPTSQRKPGEYLPMLNAAVATGAYITLQAGPEDPALNAPEMEWFRQALRESNEHIAEIRSGGAVAVPGPSDARHDVLHFSNGVSTVALFDGQVPSSLPGGLEARRHGVRIDEGLRACGPWSSCFYFNGAPRFPTTYEAPPLEDPGSWLMLPAHPQTQTSSVTLSVWFKTARNAGGYLLEKGPLGYGVYAYTDAAGTLWVGGHLSGDLGASLLGTYTPVEPQQWHHYVYSYDDATRRVRSYVDGARVHDVTLPTRGSAVTSAWSPTWIGGLPATGPAFHGWLNDIRIYGRALTDDEVGKLNAREYHSSDTLIAALDAQQPAVAEGALYEVSMHRQHTAFVVPVLSPGAALGRQTVRLTFDGPFRRAPRLDGSCPAAHPPRLRPDRSVFVDIEADRLGEDVCRVHVGAAE